jgi:hypothetical protein
MNGERDEELCPAMLALALMLGPVTLVDAQETIAPNRSDRGRSNMMMGPGMNQGDTPAPNSEGRSMENCPMMQSGQCPMMQGENGKDGHGMMGGGMMGGMMGSPHRPNDHWRRPDAPPQR